MEETKSQYLKIIEKSKKVFDDKNSDYGSSWRVRRVSSIVYQNMLIADPYTDDEILLRNV